jgi:hypothetical protein
MRSTWYRRLCHLGDGEIAKNAVIGSKILANETLDEEAMQSNFTDDIVIAFAAMCKSNR